MLEWLFQGMAHRWCLLDTRWLVIASAVGDVGIWIPFWGFGGLAWWILHRRPDLPLPGVVRTVMWVYLTCGATHVIEAVGLVQPVWVIAVVAKTVTAALAWYGFIALWGLVRDKADWILSSQLDFSVRLRVCEEEKLLLRAEKEELRLRLAHARVRLADLGVNEIGQGG